jgi:hypothetical protein
VDGASGKRWENGGELLHGSKLQRRLKRRLERPQIVVERVDDQRERDVLLELGRSAVKHKVPSPLGVLHELREHAGLADTRFANQLHNARLAVSEAVQRSIELGQLARPAS